MNNFQVTNVCGYARIVVVMGFAALFVMQRMSLLEATAGATAIGGLLGSIALFYTQESGTQNVVDVKTVQRDDGTTRVLVGASIPSEGKEVKN